MKKALGDQGFRKKVVEHPWAGDRIGPGRRCERAKLLFPTAG
ncbi:hypothetical protein [Streptomyces sp. T028]